MTGVLLPASLLLAQITSPPAAAMPPAALPLPPQEAEVLSLWVWTSAAIIFLLLAGIFFVARRPTSASNPLGEKDLENARIVYGFWLIIGGLVITLAVVIITVNVLRPSSIGTADIIAIVTSVTGVIGTLIAAFFGIQAAGAGRSQALTALNALSAATSSSDTPLLADPAYGPHAGNTRVSITGNGLSGAMAANFANKPGTNFEFVNDGLAHVNSPAAGDGQNVAEMTVVYASQARANRSAGTFHYYTVDPPQGAAGQTVTIRGGGFANAATVDFGVSSAAIASVGSDGSLQIAAPARTGADAGAPVDVVVKFAAGSPVTAVKVGSFRYAS